MKLLLREQPAICPNLFSSNDLLMSEATYREFGVNLDATHDGDTSFKLFCGVISSLV